MLLVTFSGLDGSGKSTHVEKTTQYLRDRGLKTNTLVTVRISATGLLLHLRKFAQQLGSSALDQKTTLSPSGARIRVYKNNRSFVEDKQRTISVFKRWIAYPIDALLLRLYLFSQLIRGVDAVVCDRYTFDKLVNLPDVHSWLSHIIKWLAPKPDLAFFVDATPELVMSRREEHDQSYYDAKYESYTTIANWDWGLEILKVSTVDSMQKKIESRIDKKLSKR